MKRIILSLMVLMLIILSGCIKTPANSPQETNPTYCLNEWQASVSYPRDERFYIQVSLSDFEKYEGSYIHSLPFGYNQDNYYLCEKERPSADICFIESINVNSISVPAYDITTDSCKLNAEKYIKDLSIGCICYYDSKLYIKSRFGEGVTLR